MVILAVKVYGPDRRAALQGLTSLIEDDIGRLEVSFDLGVRSDGFPSVTLDGEDVIVARNLLRDRWGEITESFELEGTYRGTLESWSEAGFELDAGRPVEIPGDHLGLGPGTPPQAATRFGLVPHVPLRFTFGEPPRLADAELDRLFGWRRGPGRVTANSVTRSQLRATINRAGHADDIERIERLGLLEHSVVCAEGTDPPGLLSSIGPYLPGELACVQ